jgi:hypothetical protein
LHFINYLIIYFFVCFSVSKKFRRWQASPAVVVGKTAKAEAYEIETKNGRRWKTIRWPLDRE